MDRSKVWINCKDSAINVFSDTPNGPIYQYDGSSMKHLEVRYPIGDFEIPMVKSQIRFSPKGYVNYVFLLHNSYSGDLSSFQVIIVESQAPKKVLSNQERLV